MILSILNKIVFVDLNPIKGHEQKGFRAAVIISNNPFNQFTKMVIVCPITSNTKEFPTHYCLKDTKKLVALFCVSIFVVLIMKLEI